jgi:hypothetical protein
MQRTKVAKIISKYDVAPKKVLTCSLTQATVHIRLGGKLCKAIVDTGASRSFVAQDIFSNIKAEKRIERH